MNENESITLQNNWFGLKCNQLHCNCNVTLLQGSHQWLVIVSRHKSRLYHTHKMTVDVILSSVWGALTYRILGYLQCMCVLSAILLPSSPVMAADVSGIVAE